VALASQGSYSDASTCKDGDRWLVTLQPDNAVVYFSRMQRWTPEQIIAEVQRQIAEEQQL
jgi:hypothetical protein